MITQGLIHNNNHARGMHNNIHEINDTQYKTRNERHARISTQVMIHNKKHTKSNTQ